MKTILVTGSAGFIGKNLCARLEEQAGVSVLRFGKDDSPDTLKELVQKSDFIFHLAAVMRPKEESAFARINTDLTKTILGLIKDSGRTIPFLLTSSIQAELDNPYGRSKKAAEEAVSAWAKTTKNPVYIFRLPNVFGRWSKPNYSSVVATFCYNVAHDLPINIHNPATVMTLAYIDDVLDEFMRTLNGTMPRSKDDFYTIPRTFTITLQELADKIHNFHKLASEPEPHFTSIFDTFLYVTYKSFLEKGKQQ